MGFYIGYSKELPNTTKRDEAMERHGTLFAAPSKPCTPSKKISPRRHPPPPCNITFRPQPRDLSITGSERTAG